MIKNRYESIKDKILNTLQTYGTDTKGPEFKQGQQADHIVDFIRQLDDLEDILESHHDDIPLVYGRIRIGEMERELRSQ